MPVLGADPVSPSRNRAASAYPPSASFSWANIVGFIVVVLLVRNVAFHDYRHEAMEYLAARGKSADEIKAYVPPTLSERRKEGQKEKTDMEQMKADITMLKQEVRTLQARLEEKDEHEARDRKQPGGEDEGGQSLDKIRFQEEEDAGKPAVSKRALRAKVIEPSETENKAKLVEEPSSSQNNQNATDERGKPSKQELEVLGSVPEGDLLG